jgi:hypothetical protein
MGETAAEIESLLGRQREQLDSDVQRLQQQLRSMVDWRTQLHRHPLPVAAVAFAVAYMFGTALGRSIQALRD